MYQKWGLQVIDRERILLIIKIGVLLVIPYEITGTVIGDSGHTEIIGLFWSFSSDLSATTRLFYNSFDVLNVILLIIPTIYFNLRVDDETPKDVVLKLGLATSIVTLLAVSIVSPYSFSAGPSSSPSPYFSLFAVILYRFVIFLLVFLVALPVLQVFEPEDENLEDESDDSDRIDDFFSLSPSQILLLVVTVIPFLLTFISATSVGQSQTTISIEGFGWSIFYHNYGYTSINQVSWTFALSSTFSSLTTIVFALSLLFIFKLLQYLDRQSNRLIVMVLGTLALLPTSFLAVLDLLLTLTGSAIFISLPIFIIQVIGWRMTKNLHQLGELDGEHREPKKTRPPVIKVPILYIAISKIRRKLRKND